MRWIQMALAWAIFWGVATPRVQAQPAGYEEMRTELALEQEGLERVVPAPDATIREIRLVIADVFAADEPWPEWFNLFHWKTRPEVVARELLFQEGEPWDDEVVSKSIRNLRDQFIFTYVVIVPVWPAGEARVPGQVDVLVHTRDLWSLRTEARFNVTGGLINELALTLIERNLLGRNIQAALAFELLPKTWRLGQSFADRRLAGSRWALTENAYITFSRDDFSFEGIQGAVGMSRPFWDYKKRWGALFELSWDHGISRQLSGQELLLWRDIHPRIWHHEIFQAEAAYRYQWPHRRHVHRLDAGFVYLDATYRPHETAGLEEGSPTQADFVAEVLPPSRRESYPYLRWQFLSRSWIDFEDLSAYGLKEELRQGVNAALMLAAPLGAFGSRGDALSWASELSYLWAPSLWGDRALLDAMASASGRLELGEIIDQSYRFRLRGASPRFLLGRLVASLDLQLRYGDSSHTQVSLGGDNGLRGFASQAHYVFGGHRFRGNVELRSPPFVFKSIHIGGVLFYDIGGVSENLTQMKLHQAAGLGLRLLLPQFNRSTIRLDFGVPLHADGFTVLIGFGSGQAVALTAQEDS